MGYRKEEQTIYVCNSHMESSLIVASGIVTHIIQQCVTLLGINLARGRAEFVNKCRDHGCMGSTYSTDLAERYSQKIGNGQPEITSVSGDNAYRTVL